MKELLKNQSFNLGFNGNNPAPTKKLIDEGEKLAHDPNTKTYSTPQELWDELGILVNISHILTKFLNF